MLALVQKLIVFVALMLVGYVGARRGPFTPDFAKAASKLTLNVFMSATILNSVISNPPEMSGGELAYSMLVAFLVLLLSYAAAAVIARLLPIRKDRAPLFELLTGVMNPMFIGIPVVKVLLGDQGDVGVFYIALSSVFFNLLIYTYGVWRLKSGDRNAMRLKDVISVPLIVTALSVVIFAFRIEVPELLRSLIDSMSPATMPMSMVVIGASLGRVSLIDAFREKSLFLVSALRLLLIPFLTWLMFLVLPADPLLRISMLVMSACPSGIIVSILAIQYGKDAEYCSKGILLDTALSMLTIPFLAWLLMGFSL
ncbi:MAG: AEC family transporter [Oscillospiraceae bacterium]|nr:AEC family transporter [Oscillospiraceae bacterium]